jgi:hypothetical protein
MRWDSRKVHETKTVRSAYVTSLWVEAKRTHVLRTLKTLLQSAAADK